MPERATDASPAWATVALSVVALLLACRAVWLAFGPGESPVPIAAATHRVEVAADRRVPQAESPAVPERMSERDFAMIAGLCPTAINELPTELVPESMLRERAERTSADPAPEAVSVLEREQADAVDEPGPPVGKLTGIRIASRSPLSSLQGASLQGAAVRVAQAPAAAPPAAEELPEGWLVTPDAWFAPEDRPASAPEPPLNEQPSQPEWEPELPPDSANEQISDADSRVSEEPREAFPAELADPTPENATAPEPTSPPDRRSDSLPPSASDLRSTQPLAPPEPPTSIEASPVFPAPLPGPVVSSPGDSVEQESVVPEATDESDQRFAPDFSSAPETADAPETDSQAEFDRDSLPAGGTDRFDAAAEEAMGGGPRFDPPGVAAPMTPPAVAPPMTDEPALPETRPDVVPTPRTEAEPEAPAAEWKGPFDSVVPETSAPPLPEPPEAPRQESRGAPEVVDPPAAEPPAAGRSMLDSPPAQTPTFETPAFDPPQPSVAPEPPSTYEVVPAPPAATPTSPALELAPRVEPRPAAPIAKPAPTRSLFPAPPAKPTVTGPAHPGGGAAASAEARKAAGGKSADESHRELFAKNNYPSAQECAACHQRIYDEWSVSSHAYAFVSPMYHKFEETISKISLGTVGHFCQRCHSPVATAMYEPRSTPLGDVAKVAREGVTCIACHRVNQRWGKSNGDRRIEPGDIYDPIYGGVGGDGVAKAIADKKTYKVKTSPHEKGPGQAIHTEGRFFDQLTRAEACTSCHQVAVHPGVKLEVVWEQYRASPACKKGVTCQDCHMGRVPGVAAGYNYGPIAELNGKTVNNHRKQSSHIFYGPGYSIAHPGIFPQNKDAEKWPVNDWLQFDWRAGWGTDEFEEKIDEYEDRDIDTASWFPKVWADTDDRADAREVIDDNLARLAKKRRYRELVMENGSKIDGPFFRRTPASGSDLEFDYVVANLNEGHNLPTASLGAQPQLWANVVLIGPDGRRVWESGNTDSNGDLCDIHSVDVRKGRLPFDKQLFNLQTMFLITGATGTDREFFLPVNVSFDQVPHLRPGTIPITATNHPPFIRMEGRSLAPLGRKRVKYTVPAELMRRPGRYRLSFRMRSRTEPMYFMRFCDATDEMLRAMTEGTLDIHPQSVEFEVW